MNIRFHYDIHGFRVKNSGEVKKVIDRISADFNKTQGAIDFVFTTEESILQINREFLKHNYFTDIITFDYSQGGCISGEIYISVPTVKENAGIFKKDFRNEIERVIFHGILHLCGLEDHTGSEQAIMRRMEDKYLGLLEPNEF